MTQPMRIESRANPLLVALRRLQRDGAAYRRGGPVWIEGEHLCAAAAARGVAVQQALLTDAAWQRAECRALARHAARIVLLPEVLMAELSGLESPGDIGFVISRSAPADPDPARDAIVLDRLQDPGNVGSILRSAAALGVTQVLALPGTAALWSPKVLRAGMGAHFSLALHEGVTADRLDLGAWPLVGTDSHAGVDLPAARLPVPRAWLFGHEGQGLAPALLARCALRVRIPQPGGEESLNVAAAAAICLYEGLRQA